MKSLKSSITDIEFLSKTRIFYENEISFAGRGLKLNKREDVKEITNAIENSKNLKVLRLEGNTISPEAADELSKSIEKQSGLERLIANDLFTGRLKDEIPLALRSICGAIDRSGAHLVEINLSDNAFGPIGLDALVDFFQSNSCFTLKEFRLHNNGLGPEGAKKLASSLEKCHKNSGGKLALRVFVCGRNRLELEGAKAVSNALKLMRSLEEIQMPQNGIRPNGIEFIADACANNPNLKVLNLNDNTFIKIGAEWISKALFDLKNLEYVNLGDCLLKSKGALLVARALSNSANLKELILSFNEIRFDAGLEIAKIMAKKANSIKILDLNGNKFGEDGKLEIMKILEPLGENLSTLSEDEGSDEEEEEVDEGEEDEEEEEEEDEEENSEVIVDENGEPYEDEYDEVNDYDDYENEGEDEDENDDEEEEEDGEEDEQNTQQNNNKREAKFQERYGSFNIVQPTTTGTGAPDLFKPFNQNQNQNQNNFKFNPPSLNFNKLNLNASNNQQSPTMVPNLFTNLVNNKYLTTGSIQSIDAFISNPNANSFKSIDETSLKKLTQLEKFNGKYLLLFLVQLAKVYDKSSKESDIVFNCANYLTNEYLKNPDNYNIFIDEFLTHFGFLKSEEKNFHPIDLDDKLASILQRLFKSAIIPDVVYQKILSYLKMRNSDSSSNLKFKNNSQILINSLS